MKRYIITLLAAALALSLGACSSKPEESSDAEDIAADTTSEISDFASETGGDDFADFGSDEMVTKIVDAVAVCLNAA